MISTHFNEETHCGHFHNHHSAIFCLVWIPDATDSSNDTPTMPGPGYAAFIETSGFFAPFQGRDCVPIPSKYQGKR
jgi:hypothetical protein